MTPLTRDFFEMGPLYDIMRNGVVVATRNGIPSSDESRIGFENNTDVRVGDILVEQITREEFPVARVKPKVSGSQVLLIEAHRSAERRTNRSHTTVTQHIGTVHGAVAGRDLHGDVTLNMTVGDVLHYLRQEIEKTTDAEEKKSLLQRLDEFSKHPIVVALATNGIAAVGKWMTGQP